MNTMIWPASCQKLQISWNFDFIKNYITHGSEAVIINIETKNAPIQQVKLTKIIPKGLSKSELFEEAKECLLNLAYQNKYGEYQRSLYMYDTYAVEDFIDDLEKYYYGKDTSN